MKKDLPSLDGHAKSTDTLELTKSKVCILVEIVEYVPNAVVSRTILRKTTGNVTAISFAEGEELADKLTPFDTFVQVIDGSAEVVVDNKTYQLPQGAGIVIPAHKWHRFNAAEQFKMICTVIKNGYEE
jgi:quercetin dioxygenase-like cupin family protein